MKSLVETAEAAERLEEVTELVHRRDKILICRERRPMDGFLKLAADGRKSVPAGTTFDHDDLYDEHGLPR